MPPKKVHRPPKRPKPIGQNISDSEESETELQKVEKRLKTLEEASVKLKQSTVKIEQTTEETRKAIARWQYQQNINGQENRAASFRSPQDFFRPCSSRPEAEASARQMRRGTVEAIKRQRAGAMRRRSRFSKNSSQATSRQRRPGNTSLGPARPPPKHSREFSTNSASEPTPTPSTAPLSAYPTPPASGGGTPESEELFVSQTGSSQTSISSLDRTLRIKTTLLKEGINLNIHRDEPLDFTTPENAKQWAACIMSASPAVSNAVQKWLVELKRANGITYSQALDPSMIIARKAATDIRCLRTYVTKGAFDGVKEDGPHHACKVCRDLGGFCIQCIRINGPHGIDLFLTALPLAEQYRSEDAEEGEVEFYQHNGAPYMHGAKSA